ncbi:MAG: methylenetetrahydrofolate reductase [Spirochaetaceae bacterium]|jgi:methylenetetrahydrofolate reductase (NADPH)|nr:methylenetetrahydrofolate reductase [Spirochaetaceae bacterium]
MEVSLELVPRSRGGLEAGAFTAARFAEIGYINVPDLARFSIRSWEACGMLAALSPGSGGQAGFGFIPHLRARDFLIETPFPYGELFRERGITRVLVIAGDPPAETGSAYQGGIDKETGTVPFIKKLKREFPELEIYAAFDPYRTNIRYELDYLREKEDAGASAFMSQPFFDLRLLEIYAEYLEGKRVFWGTAPVISAGNRNYWESRNRAVFPRQFRADLDWNIAYGKKLMEFCKGHDFHLYLMPIKVELGTYLEGLFG